jgi:hypothetical protein
MSLFTGASTGRQLMIPVYDGSHPRVFSSHRMIKEDFNNVLQSIIGAAFQLASITSNGWKSCIFILTHVERNEDSRSSSSLSESSGSSKRAKPKASKAKDNLAKESSPHKTPYTFRGEQLTKSEYMRKMRATYHAESTMIATQSLP